ncbi:MAG: helix-turn-helix transcriptional regulator [Candidatus Eremiobacteraeota bacterium]|nr:helix-turn-helix transcriptional regulator [Candidatus Eremiobacteraeota bacterium]
MGHSLFTCILQVFLRLHFASCLEYCQGVSHRSPCPIACTLDLLGDRWTLLVVRDLIYGRSQFKEFLASPEGIATNILSNRLARLCEAGLVSRTGTSYALTEKGRTLGPVLEAVRDWGLSQLPGTGVFM